MKQLATLLIGLSAGSALASGFALYEPSASAHALGGATLGKAVDASANFINPATLADFTNNILTVGFVTEHPRCKVHVDGRRREKLDPGLFWLPHFMLAVPLPKGWTFGFAGDAEYGLGTKYGQNWSMNWSTTETTVQGYVLNPNLAYAVTDKWSVGVGLRWLYFDFEQFSCPWAPGGVAAYDNHLHGDNNFSSVGWQLGTRYRLVDNFSVGLVYKSAIDVSVKGDCETKMLGFREPYAAALNELQRRMILAGAQALNGSASADLTLPQSVTGGFNWDITDTVHFGAAVSWTEWSKLGSLTFHLPAGQKKYTKLDWHDTWRFSLAPSWDFAEDWTFMVSYVFDMDCTDSHQCSAMLPPADRHILGGGLTWRVCDNLECTLSYACVFMEGGTMEMPDGQETMHRLKSQDGFCHAGGFSVTYRF